MDMPTEAINTRKCRGELQLDAGQVNDAVRTIRQLARLEPDKAGDYQRLLGHILRQSGEGAGGDT